jgi:hypothetical protein
MAIKLQWSDKDPQAVLDYDLDWAEWLTSYPGDTLSSATWSTPSPVTSPPLIASSPYLAGSKSVVWLSGGLAGSTYTTTCTIYTTGGRIDERTVTVKVRQL